MERARKSNPQVLLVLLAAAFAVAAIWATTALAAGGSSVSVELTPAAANRRWSSSSPMTRLPRRTRTARSGEDGSGGGSDDSRPDRVRRTSSRDGRGSRAIAQKIAPASSPSRLVPRGTSYFRLGSADHGRDPPLAPRPRDPYAILVTEVMLQQTQVERVIPRWLAWLDRWPTPGALAAASPADVIREWQGLGYNRRAVNLHRAAHIVAARAGPTP